MILTRTGQGYGEGSACYRAAGIGSLIIGLLILLVGSLYSQALANNVTQLYAAGLVRQESVVLHFDLDSSDADAELFMLSNPDRLVIDFPRTILSTELPVPAPEAAVISQMRYAQHGEDYLRIVLDLKGSINPRSRLVPRAGGQRLVLDLGVEAGSTSTGNSPGGEEGLSLREAIVAIDAGHGGRDPGAVGAGKTLEKDITLAVALKLHERLLQRPGIRPVLIRDADYYVELRERIRIASEHKADVFVSIHADAVDHAKASGGSVYALSIDGATSEAAAWLAKSENESAALYGDVSLQGLDDTLRETLLSLAQNNTMERSIEVGEAILEQLGAIGNLHKQSVEQADFAVLKSPDIPSVLVETAFISNRREERKLNDPAYQDRIAKAIEHGLVNYLRRRAPEGTLLAAQRRKRGS